MSKRYVIKEESNSGCWSFLGIMIVLGIFVAYLPIIAGIAVILAIIWRIFYYPKYKAEKQRKKEEAEIAERERQLDLEQKRMDLEARERELKAQRNKSQELKDDTWDDF